jgi:hypothetical protein
MHYLLESFFVGGYTVFLYIPLSYLMKPLNLQFFLLGFLKHFLGHIIGLHDYYCNQGYQCKLVHSREKNVVYQYDETRIISESVLEGLYFLVAGSLLFNEKTMNFKRENVIAFVFFIGFFTHLVFELLGIHEYVCNIKCKKNK